MKQFFKMKKWLNMILIVVFGLFTTQIMAKTLSLSPKQSKSLTNHFLWKINATCNIQGTSKGKILVSVVKNKGTVNGKNLSSGQSTALNLASNQQISVSAEPGTEVHLVNQGDDPVQAVCSV